MFVPLTPLEFKRRAVLLFGAKIGVIDGERRFTYAEFGNRADRLSAALVGKGLHAGDRVAYLSYNSHQLLEGYFGVLGAGGLLLPLNIRLGADEIAYILHDSGARFLFADPDFASVIADLPADSYRSLSLTWLRPLELDREGENYEDMLDRSSPVPPELPAIDENATAELFYTSGTTGRPKGVMLTHRNLYLHALAGLIVQNSTDADVQLHTIPLFHVNGWGTPQALTGVGGTHVMMRKFDAAQALRLVEAERVTSFYVVPTMMNMMLNHPDVASRDLSSLRVVMLGGSPAPTEMVRRAQDVLKCDVMSGYGLSETSPVLSVARHKAHLADEPRERRIQRQASTGLPVIGVDLRVVDEADQELPWDGDTVGEIVVRGNTVMRGYWNDQEATDGVIRDGWFHTGDMAVVDAEGYVLIVDRKKDIIVSGGENISSVEIENVIFEHPAVLEDAVVGIPDDQWGEVPCAFIVLRTGQTATAEDIMAFCRERLAGFKIPHSVEFLTELPKGGTGKILKRQLREPYWQGQTKRVN